MKDMDPHILNFYEDVVLPLSDVPELVRKALLADLEDPREKLDGQNFTFTVTPKGQVRFMGKGCPKWIRGKGGLDRKGLRDLYEKKPQVQRAFTEAYDVLQGVINSMPYGSIAALFMEGDGIISAEVVTPINQNIVRYNQNAVCFIEWRILGMPSSPNSMHSGAFREFCELAKMQSPYSGWVLTDVPMVRPRPAGNAQALVQEMVAEFRTMAMLYNMGPNATMGDLLTSMVERELRTRVPMVGAFMHRAARRLAYDDPSILRHSDFPSSAAWEAFRPLDDERAAFVGDCIAPVEDFFRRLGQRTIESYEFALVNIDDRERVDELHTFVARVRDAVKRGKVRALTPEVMGRIESALRRVDESLFTRNAEGIVFRWRGKMKKLTGGFTAINRLHGYFNFENPAIIDG